MRVARRAVVLVALAAIGAAFACRPRASTADAGFAPPAPQRPGARAEVACGPGAPPMTVRFYDVGQGLAVLVDLPDGRRVLVDTGDNPRRSDAQCHGACPIWHERLMAGLARDVGARGIDLLWITHQHSDHLGGAVDVLDHFAVKDLVDNGEDVEKAEVRRVHDAAARRGTRLTAVGPGARELPIASTAAVRFTAVVPPRWPTRCESDANDCSIGLRIDYCRSSVLFVGDAERREEALLDPGGPVTLLQVAHHGSDTSSSAAWLARAQPSYAVVSAGHPQEGSNLGYCHPRQGVVERLVAQLGGAPAPALAAFDGQVSCTPAHADHWHQVATSDRLFVTARDGDVVLATTGDGRFERRR